MFVSTASMAALGLTGTKIGCGRGECGWVHPSGEGNAGILLHDPGRGSGRHGDHHPV